MVRILSISIALAAVVSMSGCLMGPCGGGGHCNSCDGYVGPGMLHHPGDGFRHWRRSLTCGAGCGDTYYDEWYSTPPDCVDPCPQFDCGGGCGGCGHCGSVCGCGCGCELIGHHGDHGTRILNGLGALVAGLYGKRFCGACGYAYDDCGCDGGYIGGEIIEDGGYIDGHIIEGGTVIEGPVMQGPTPAVQGTSGTGNCPDGNCSIGNRPSTPMARRIRRSPAYEQAMARQQAAADLKAAQAQTERPTPERVVYPEEPNAKFYRQATRLPRNRSLRR